MAPTSPIEVDFSLSLGERYAANVYILVRRLRYLLYVLAICMVICVIGLSPRYLPEELGDRVYAFADWLSIYSLLTWAYPILVGGGFATVVLVPLAAFFRARAVKKRFAGDDSHYIFSVEGVKVKSALGSADLKWEMFAMARESRRFFFLYSIPTMANLVPKRIFTSTTEIAEFRSLLRAHVKKVSLRKD